MITNKKMAHALPALFFAASGMVSSLALAEKPAIPADGERYFILGQDQTSIEEYMATDAPRPSGLTAYVTLARGEKVFVDGSEYCFKGLEGLKNIEDYKSNTAEGCGKGDSRRQNRWGSGVQNVQWIIDTYNSEIVSIGLWCPSNDNLPSLYQNNAYDDLLTELADFFNNHSNTKFFLRTCYEFNGDAGGWSPENFRETFKYVRKFMDKSGVNNVSHVWQSDSFHSTGRSTTNALGNKEEGYWPGKQFVDWVGSSQFYSDVGEEATIAELEGLPHFIAEATPHGKLGYQYDFAIPYGATIAAGPQGGKNLLHDLDWFIGKNHEITRNSTKAWHYINAEWKAQPQWRDAPDQDGANFFTFTDSRIQLSDKVKSHFKEMVTKENGFILGN